MEIVKILLSQPNLDPNISCSGEISDSSNPSKLTVRSHPCELVYMNCPYLFNGFGCDICGSSGNGMVYHCRDHQFDAHPECAKRDMLSNSDEEAFTPLAVAMSNKFKDIVSLLLSHPSIDKSQVIFTACRSGDDDSLRTLLSSSSSNINDCDENDNTALMIAAKEGYEKCIKALLDYPEIDLMVRNQDGETAFSLACIQGHLETLKILLAHPSISLKELLNREEENLLHLSCKSNQIEIVKYLFDHPNIEDIINKADNGLKFPLFIAIESSYTEIMKLLVSHPSLDVNLKGRKGMNCLHIAVQGSDVNILKILIDHNKVDVDAQREDGATPLHLAVSNNLYDIVKLLLQYGSSIDIRDSGGRSVLDIARNDGVFDLLRFPRSIFQSSTSGDMDTLKENLQFQTIKTKLYYNSDKNNALHQACKNGRTEVVRLLLELPYFNVNEKNRLGSNPLLLATKSRHTEIVQLLLNHKNINVNEVTDYWKCNSNNCSGCMNKPSEYYLCDHCNLQFCLQCLDSESIPPITYVSNHPHQLSYCKIKGDWNCVGENCNNSNCDISCIRYRCDQCNIDYCSSCVGMHKSEWINDGIDTIYLRPIPHNDVKVRRTPSFSSEDCGLTKSQRSYKFDKVDNDWGKLSSREFDRLKACAERGDNNQILFQDHDPEVEGWCPLIKNGDVLFESALYNKARFPTYRGTSSGRNTFYCGRRLGKAIVGDDSDGQCGPNNGPACPDCREFQQYNRKLIENKSIEEMSTMELVFKVYDMKIEKKAKGIFHRDGLISLVKESIVIQKNLYPQVVSISTGVERTGSANWKDDKGNILFHFNPRPNEGQIVMNTLVDSWGKEERISLPGGGGPLIVVVEVTKEGYSVTKDDSVLHLYHHRIPFEEFSTIQNDESWTVTIHDNKKESYKCDHVFENYGTCYICSCCALCSGYGKDCYLCEGRGIIILLSIYHYYHYHYHC